jgi:DNA-binding FrmR family transcriptional regulator
MAYDRGCSSDRESAMRRADSSVLHDSDSKRAIDARLARIEGQVRGVRRMIAADNDCEQIALQLAAARKALDRAFYQMVSCMIRADAPTGAAARREHAERVAEILARFG